MAKRVLMKTIGGEGRGFNINDTVGFGGKNNPDDVMLIQAILKYLDSDSNVHKSTKELTKEVKAISKPTGILDSATGKAIRSFQRSWNLIISNQDGLVRPAMDTNEGATMKRKISMMLQLNIFAKLTAASLSDRRVDLDYTEAIFRMYPQLRSHVTDD